MSFGQYSERGSFSSARNGRKYSNDQAVHVWAQQNEQHGSNQKGSIFWTGPTIYSYGTHFPMGHFMPCGEVVLINSDGASVTTTAHQRRVRMAVNHRRTLYVPALASLCDRWGPLALLRSDRDESEQGRGRLALAAYLAKYGPDMGREAFDYLAALAKLNGSRLLAKAVKERADKSAREDKAARKHLLDCGKAFAAMSDGEFFAHVAEHTDRYSFPRFIKDMRRYHRAASAAKFTARKTRLWQLIALLDDTAAIQRARKRNDIVRANKYAREHITTIRALIQRATTPLDANPNAQEFHSGDWGRLQSAIRLLRDSAPRLRKSSIMGNLYHFAGANCAHESKLEVERAAEFRRTEGARREAERAALKGRWLAGEPVRWTGAAADGSALLRIVDRDRSGTAEGEGRLEHMTLETSQGAEVPLRHALRVFQFVKLCRERGTAWHRNGRTLRVGHFQVDAIDTQGNFTAGCHNIGWSEVERVAKEHGLFDLPAHDFTESKAEANA